MPFHIPVRIAAQEWGRNNFLIGITIEYSTTGIAGGYLMDRTPKSTHQPVQIDGIPRNEGCRLSLGCGQIFWTFFIPPLISGNRSRSGDWADWKPAPQGIPTLWAMSKSRYFWPVDMTVNGYQFRCPVPPMPILAVWSWPAR